MILSRRKKAKRGGLSISRKTRGSAKKIKLDSVAKKRSVGLSRCYVYWMGVECYGC